MSLPRQSVVVTPKLLVPRSREKRTRGPCKSELTWKDLPTDVLYEILSRVPYSHTPILSNTSKLMDSLVTTRAMHDHRSSSLRTEIVVHVGLADSQNQLTWFSLRKKPFKDEFVLCSIPNFPHLPRNTTLASVGSKIYGVGGEKVTCVDCFDYCELEVPRMNANHSIPEIVVLRNVLYVLGGVGPEDTRNLIEAYDLNDNSPSWTAIDVASKMQNVPSYSQTMLFDEKIYFIDNKGKGVIVFEPLTLNIEKRTDVFVGKHEYDRSCVIGRNVYTLGKRQDIRVYNFEKRRWFKVDGLSTLPDLDIRSTWLLNYDGNLLIIDNNIAENVMVTLLELEETKWRIRGKILSRNRALHLNHPTTIYHTLKVRL